MAYFIRNILFRTQLTRGYKRIFPVGAKVRIESETNVVTWKVRLQSFFYGPVHVCSDVNTVLNRHINILNFKKMLQTWS